MAASASVPGSGDWPSAKTFLTATALAGVLDLGYAIVVSALRGVAPERVCQSIASGLLGRASYDGGLATAALGVALHFLIMAVIVLTWASAGRFLPGLRRQPVLWGPLYGAVVFVVMNYVVLPLSAMGHAPVRPWLLLIGELGSHLFFVGLTIAWLLRAPSRGAAAAPATA